MRSCRGRAFGDGRHFGLRVLQPHGFELVLANLANAMPMLRALSSALWASIVRGEAVWLWTAMRGSDGYDGAKALKADIGSRLKSSWFNNTSSRRSKDNFSTDPAKRAVTGTNI